jgi:hypothetical protein
VAREASAAVRVQEFGLRSALQRNTLKDRRVDPRPKQYRYRRDVQVEEQRDGHPKPTVRRAVVWEDRQQERESERGEPPQGHGENRAGAMEGNMRFVSGAKGYTTDMTSAGRSSVTGIRSRPTGGTALTVRMQFSHWANYARLRANCCQSRVLGSVGREQYFAREVAHGRAAGPVRRFAHHFIPPGAERSVPVRSPLAGCLSRRCQA